LLADRILLQEIVNNFMQMYCETRTFIDSSYSYLFIRLGLYTLQIFFEYTVDFF